MTVLAVYGFGLIGASIAAAVRQAEPKTRIVAIDLPHLAEQPELTVLADEFVDSSNAQEVRRVVELADCCVLSAPVSVIEREGARLLQWARVLTDCGSTKRSIAAAIQNSPRRGRFVLGHPMAGGPEGGAARARPELFRGQSWLLCPENSDADALACVEALIARVGAKSAHLSVGAHDRAVAYTSHAPQLLASALAALTRSANAEVAAGPAYRGATRTAGGAEVMWQDIFLANADQVAVVLRELIAELGEVAVALERSPAEVAPALRLLARARASRVG